MKTYLNYSQNNHINNNMLMRKHKAQAGQKYKEKLNTRENKELNRPARAISFGGSVSLDKFAKKATSAFNSTVEFVNDNEAAYNAIYSLIIAGMLKPLFVLNMPGSEEKDKQIVATKNFLQAFLGSFMSLTIGGGFVKKAIDIFKRNKKLITIDENNTVSVLEATNIKVLEEAKKILKKEGKNPSIDEIAKKASELVENIRKNHLKIFQKNPEFLKQIKIGAGDKTTLEEASEVLWKNSTGAITAILKAKVSSLLLPAVMAFLFAKKNLEKEMQEKAKEELLNSKLTAQQQEIKKALNKKENKVSFKGNILDSAIDGTASLIEKGAMSKTGVKLTELLSRTKKPSARMSDFESFAITAYWLQNTARNKKIEPSQRLGLNIHSTLVTIVSSACAFIIDWALDGVIDESKNKYSNKLKNIAASLKAPEGYKTLDEVLKDMPDVIRMGIKDEIIKLLDSKEIAELPTNKIKQMVKNNLENTANFKGFNFDSDTIENAIESLKQSEPIRKNILNQTENMIGSKDIAKNLSRAIGDEKAIAKEIANLTNTYGKKLSKFKSLTIFTLVVRFLVPVLMVPFSGKLKKKIVEWTSNKENKKDAVSKK